ncbi:MAG: hypothetical protein AAGI38_22530, partial [Bacteroidota bacterium]
KPLPPSINKNAIINPVSHETGFMALRRAMSDTANLRNYFRCSDDRRELTYFAQEVRSGNIQYLQTNNITYHLLQIDGWIITLDLFDRESPNSGWLISSLRPAVDRDKDHYLKKVLNL